MKLYMPQMLILIHFEPCRLYGVVLNGVGGIMIPNQRETLTKVVTAEAVTGSKREREREGRERDMVLWECCQREPA